MKTTEYASWRVAAEKKLVLSVKLIEYFADEDYERRLKC